MKNITMRSEGNSLWNLPPKRSVVFQFCEETSLDGLKYIGQKNRPNIERIFWFIAFIIGLISAGLLIADVWYKYGTNPIIVTFGPDEISISAIPFPAITICNSNRILKSVVLEIEKNLSSSDEQTRLKAEEETNLVNSICTSNPSVFQLINSDFSQSTRSASPFPLGTNMIDLLYKLSQPCDEMIHRCFAGSIEFPCKQEFHSIITEAGMCCTANMLPSSLLLHYPNMFEPEHKVHNNLTLEYFKTTTKIWSNWDFKKDLVIDKQKPHIKSSRPIRQYKSGKSYGVNILLFPDLDNYYCTSGDSLGFKVVAHTPLEFPHPLEYGFAIKPGTEVFANVIPEITMADEGIYDVNISSRHCFFPDERPLKYFKAYTDANCIDECGSNYTAKACGCVKYFQPHDNKTRLCDDSDHNCINGLTENTARGITHCSKCYPLCDELDYRLEFSESILQSFSATWRNGENNSIPKPVWYGKHVTILNMFYGQRTTVPKVRKKLFETTDLIASIGGLLGLCLGFSGMSAVEIIYFCTIRPWFQKHHLSFVPRKIGTVFTTTMKQMSTITTVHHPQKDTIERRSSCSV